MILAALQRSSRTAPPPAGEARGRWLDLDDAEDLSRLHQLLLVQLNRKQEGIIEHKALARATGASDKDIKKILRILQGRGM